MADRDEAYSAAKAKADAAGRDALGGQAAEKMARDLLGSLHAYAQATGCPPGGSVIRWFSDRWDAAAAAHSAVMRTHFAARRKAESASDPKP